MGVNLLLPLDSLQAMQPKQGDMVEEQATTCCSQQLWKIAGESVGLSGRTLRKLPFLAIAMLAESSGRHFIFNQLFSVT
jgi:hypothetical protein